MFQTKRNAGTAVVSTSVTEPATPTESMRAVQSEVASVIDTLPMMQRFGVNRRLSKDVAATVTELAAGMMKAAAAAEIACFEQQMAARRMDAAAMLLLNRGTLLRVVVQNLSVTQSALFRLAMEHEDRIDSVAGPWADAIRLRQAADRNGDGRIDHAMLYARAGVPPEAVPALHVRDRSGLTAPGPWRRRKRARPRLQRSAVRRGDGGQ